jgi:hypothetical protein
LKYLSTNRGAPCAFILPSIGRRLVLAASTQTFAKLRSDKDETKHHESRVRACLLQSICRVFGNSTAR